MRTLLIRAFIVITVAIAITTGLIYIICINVDDEFAKPISAQEKSQNLGNSQSLGQIYSAAKRMDFGSTEDQQILTSAVQRYMQDCCTDYENAVRELHDAGFETIEPISDTYSSPLQLPSGELIKFDRVVIWNRKTVDWLSFPPVITEQSIRIHFDSGRMVYLHSALHTEGL